MVSSVFVVGSVFLAFVHIEIDGFVASASQYAGATVAIVVLVVAAFLVGRRPLPGRRRPPRARGWSVRWRSSRPA